MKPTENATPPAGLSKAAKTLWLSLTREFSIGDPGGLLLLRTALEAFDRLQEARKILKRDGLIVFSKGECPRPHPMLVTERDARSGLIQALKALHLDIEPIQGRMGRPSGSPPASEKRRA